ncbi:MAG: hypothetical protein A2132_00270 [Nitrospirae bacterium RBG_16_43_11]|nr:MAG: hypothetical protein A2132_00270 [Nitrospirae bacterium RBG_16_43_11]
MSKRPFSVVIPNYNGHDLLDEYLPSVFDAARSYSDQYDVIIVDDGSKDQSVDLIRRKYPEARIIVNEKNVGFGEAVNRGVKACKHSIIVLLNNDVRVEKDFFEPLLSHFDQERVFAVVAKGLIEQDGVEKNESVTRYEFKDGVLNLIQPGLLNPGAKFEEVCTVSHACGGFSAFDRDKFLSLGGFDTLYYPFYWEDVDICYRAWKRGWWSLYEPRSVAHHRCHATIDNINKRDYVWRIHTRNGLLFTWKNVTDNRMLMEHAKTLLRRLLRVEPGFGLVFYEAIKKFAVVYRSRMSSMNGNRYSDSDIITLSANNPVPEKTNAKLTKIGKEY